MQNHARRARIPARLNNLAGGQSRLIFRSENATQAGGGRLAAPARGLAPHPVNHGRNCARRRRPTLEARTMAKGEAVLASAPLPAEPFAMHERRSPVTGAMP